MGHYRGVGYRYGQGRSLLDEATAAFLSTRSTTHPFYGVLLERRGVLLSEQGRPEEAIALFREAQRLMETYLPRDHPRIGELLDRTGRTLRDYGRFEEAEPWTREARELFRRSFGPDNAKYYAKSTFRLAKLMTDMGRADEAVALAEEAHRIFLAATPGHYATIRVSQSALANAWHLKQRTTPATLDTLRAWHAFRQGYLGFDHRTTGRTAFFVGRLLALQDRYAEAEPYLEDAYAILLTQSGLANEHTINAKVMLAELYTDWGLPEQARSLETLETWHAFRQKRFGAEHPATGRTALYVGRLLAHQDRYTEAEPYLEEAYAVLAAQPAPGNDRTTDAKAALAKLYTEWGKPDQAPLYQAEP
ncbi:MAG: tetratricopeptide repeat protein [Bacteroidota bacterium]